MKKNKSKSIEKTLLRAKPKIYFYKDFVKQSKPPINDKIDHYPCIVPNWDNTPRSGARGVVLHDSTSYDHIPPFGCLFINRGMPGDFYSGL